MNAILFRHPVLFVIIGLIVLFVPSYWGLALGIWQSDAQFHAPIILIFSFWLLWRNFRQARQQGVLNPLIPANVSGSIFLGVGLLIYILGRSQEMALFEVVSQIPILTGVLLLVFGRSCLRWAWFPLFFMFFMVPLPGSVIDSLTGPLKQAISYTVENLLYEAGYPIARVGVTLMVGHYQLLIADACSGLNSMFSLGALGMLFIYLIDRPSKLFNALMIASIIPIAFLANMVRVTLLVLITFYWGDEAGQGFLHGFAGMVLFLTAIGGFILLDIGLIYIISKAKSVN